MSKYFKTLKLLYETKFHIQERLDIILKTKIRISVLVLFIAAMFVSPLLSLLGGGTWAASSNVTQSDEVKIIPDQKQSAIPQGEPMLIFDAATNTVLEMSEFDYVIGAVMSEIPLSYNAEAIKAQAVATHTYALFVKAYQQKSPTPELLGGYLSVNTDTRTGFMTEQKGREFYGDSYDDLYKKLFDSVTEVFGNVVTYDKQIISACYFAISSGATENSENVFSTPLPYLVTVDSSWDGMSERFTETKILTPSDFSALMTLNFQNFETFGSPNEWVGEPQKSQAGTVLSLNVCGLEYSGVEIRSALSLRSAAFDITYDDEQNLFEIVTKGYGHNVGLSQFGANIMAGKGNSYDEILTYYYTGTEITKIY